MAVFIFRIRGHIFQKRSQKKSPSTGGTETANEGTPKDPGTPGTETTNEGTPKDPGTSVDPKTKEKTTTNPRSPGPVNGNKDTTTNPVDSKTKEETITNPGTPAGTETTNEGTPKDPGTLVDPKTKEKTTTNPGPPGPANGNKDTTTNPGTPGTESTNEGTPKDPGTQVDPKTKEETTTNPGTPESSKIDPGLLSSYSPTSDKDGRTFLSQNSSSWSPHLPMFSNKQQRITFRSRTSRYISSHPHLHQYTIFIALSSTSPSVHHLYNLLLFPLYTDWEKMLTSKGKKNKKKNTSPLHHICLSIHKNTRLNIRIRLCIQLHSSHTTLGCWFRERIHSGQYYWEVKGLTDISLNTGIFKNTYKCPTSWYVGVTNQSAEQKSEVPVTPQNGYWALQYDKDKGYYVNDPSLTPVL
ncbi:hypothetical protein NFI96_030064, partial [Prochilodus magdalenae]